ncbi:response regulator transcription factor [Chloroflexota bacterium]
MVRRPNSSELVSGEVERLAARRASERSHAPRWDVNSVVLAYAVLTVIIILGFQDVAVEIVAPIAILGLGLVWFLGWRRGKQQYRYYYDEELQQLQGVFHKSESRQFEAPPLSPRELEILNHIACGYINKQVARKLGISEQTIKNHMSSILRKLEVNDRTQAVVMAMSCGWVSVNSLESPKSADDTEVDSNSREQTG